MAADDIKSKHYSASIRPRKGEGASLPDNVLSTQELEDVITLLQKSGVSIESETTLLVMLQNILNRIAKETGEQLDIHHLSAEQEKLLQEALERIARELQESGLMEHDANLQKLIRILLGSQLKREKEKKKQRENAEEHEEEEEQEHKLESLSQKQKAQLKKLFKLFVMYEAYKITNPNQLAGETKMDNFIHNLKFRGEEFAIRKSGSDMGLGEQQIKEMQKEHKSFVQTVTEVSKNPEKGWSR